jgi:hypothetical protein
MLLKSEVLLVVLDGEVLRIVETLVHLELEGRMRVLGRPVLCQVFLLSSVPLFELVGVDVLQNGAFLALLHEMDPSLLTFVEKVTDHVPELADALGVEDEDHLHVGTVVGLEPVQSKPEIAKGYVGDAGAVEVEDQHILLGVVGHHFVPKDHQHEIVDGVEVLVDAHFGVVPVQPHHHNWSEFPVMAIGVYLATLQSSDRALVEPCDGWIVVILHDLNEPLHYLLLLPVASVNMLQYDLVPQPTSSHTYPCLILSLFSSCFASIRAFSSSRSYFTR